MTTWTPASIAARTLTWAAAALVKSTRTSAGAAASASAAVAYTAPCPAADRETPEVSVRSSAVSMAARIGGAVHPVTPAKQILIMETTLEPG
jgi:hypothetical protein